MVGAIQMVAMFVCLPLVKPLVAKFGKKETALIGMSITTIVYTVLFFLKDLSAMQFVSVVAVGTFSMYLYNFVTWAFITDVTDYHEYKTSMREDATVYGIIAMARKVGLALAGGIGGAAIAAVGYDATRGTQTQEVLEGIYALGTIVPAILYGLVVLVLFMYPLNKKKTAQLAEDLAAKRNSKN